MTFNSLMRQACLSIARNLKFWVRSSSKKAGCSKVQSMCRKPFAAYPCGHPSLQLEKKVRIRRSKKSKSMWENPFCDEGDLQCPYNPRFDDIYYVESDKATRKYWQTWASCPPMKAREKVCYGNAVVPTLKRRKHKKPKTACKMEKCIANQYLGCPRAMRRCHKTGRIPPKCNYYPPPADCDKPLAPYPSFSECNRLRPGAMPLSECLCLRTPMLCEIWTEWRRRAIYKRSNLS